MMEIELKLEVAAADAEALLGSPLFGNVDRQELTSVYFDTDAGELRAAGFSLRVRHAGPRRVQTIKADGAAAGLFVRGEWEQEIASDTPVLASPEQPLQQRVGEEVLARIGPVFRSRISRSKVVSTCEEATIELACDRGDVVAGDRSAAVCEVELELLQGPQAALFEMARRIDDIVPVRLGMLSKSERGYRLADGSDARAAKSAPAALTADMTAAAAFQTIAAACIRQFRLNEMLLAISDDARALHQARVALRRLRSALSLFRPMLADDAFDHIRSELRWIAGALGEARNIDVLVDRFTGEEALSRLHDARRRAYADVAEALASRRMRRLMLDLSEWLALGAWLANPDTAELRGRAASSTAADMLDRRRRRVKHRGHDLLDLDDERRHELRIEVKKLRYAAEFFAPLYPGKKRLHRMSRFREALEALQERLGDLNDLATMSVMLDRLGLRDMLAGQATAGKARSKTLRQAQDAYDGMIGVRRFWS